MTSHLIEPHGGKLVDLTVSPARANEIKSQSRDWPSWDLTPRQLCDLELLCNGGFSPLTGFMGKADYESVCDKMRLTDGTLWPMPITLDVSQEFADKLKTGDKRRPPRCRRRDAGRDHGRRHLDARSRGRRRRRVFGTTDKSIRPSTT